MPIVDIRPVLRTFLLADSAISTAVGGERVYPVVLLQGQTLADAPKQLIADGG
jgi:hypothetical protein